MRTALALLALFVAAACGGDDGGEPAVDASVDAAPIDAATTNGVACGDETVCTAPDVCCASETTQSCDLAENCAEGACITLRLPVLPAEAGVDEKSEHT